MSDSKIKKGGIPTKSEKTIVTGEFTIQSGGLPEKKNFQCKIMMFVLNQEEYLKVNPFCQKII